MELIGILIISVWGISFILLVIYSYIFMYKDYLNRPLGYHRVKKILSIIEIATLVAVIFYLFKEDKWLYIFIIIFASFFIRFIIKKITYNRAVKEMVAFYQQTNKMPLEKAIFSAKVLIDMEIKNGKRN